VIRLQITRSQEYPRICKFANELIKLFDGMWVWKIAHRLLFFFRLTEKCLHWNEMNRGTDLAMTRWKCWLWGLAKSGRTTAFQFCSQSPKLLVAGSTFFLSLSNWEQLHSNECLHFAKSNRANLTGNPMANSLSMWVSSVEVSNRRPFTSSWIIPLPSALNAHSTHLHKFLNAGESLGQNRYASSKHVDHLHGQIEAWSARVQRHADICSG